jgi:hypothetical protein
VRRTRCGYKKLGAAGRRFRRLQRRRPEDRRRGTRAERLAERKFAILVGDGVNPRRGGRRSPRSPPSIFRRGRTPAISQGAIGFTSAMMTSICSMPTLNLIISGRTPAAAIAVDIEIEAPRLSSWGRDHSRRG